MNNGLGEMLQYNASQHSASRSNDDHATAPGDEEKNVLIVGLHHMLRKARKFAVFGSSNFFKHWELFSTISNQSAKG